MTSFKSFLLILALLSTLKAHDESTCTFNSRNHTPEFLDIEEDMSSIQEGRVLTSTSKTYPNLRIYADYSRLISTAPTAYASYIQDQLAPSVVSYFEAALTVKFPVSGLLKLGSSVSTVCSKATPSILKTGVNADYVIMFDSESESGTVVASSRYCYLASGSNRPLIATTVFNRPGMLAANGDVLLHEKNVYILLHEMMHTFGISDSTYKYFVDANGKTLTNHIKSISIAGATRLVLDIPSLTTKIQQYYGCSTVPGLIMENGGGDGTADSHPEKKYFVYETMTSGGIYGRRITQFSLGLLEASGWYGVNYDYAEPFYLGQGQGCGFINDQCSSTKVNFDEYCTGSARGCANSGIGGGSCSSNSLSDGCKFVNPDIDYHCENDASADYARLPSLQTFGRGLGSKCFTGTLNTKSAASSTSFCFKYTCSGSGTNTVLQVDVGKNSVTCSAEGKVTVSGYAGTIDCPDPITFCSTVGLKYCPRNCLGRGTCVDNVCQCNSGFTGVDCGLNA